MVLDLDKLQYSGEPIDIRFNGRVFTAHGTCVSASISQEPYSVSMHGMSVMRPSMNQELELKFSLNAVEYLSPEHYEGIFDEMPPVDEFGRPLPGHIFPTTKIDVSDASKKASKKAKEIKAFKKIVDPKLESPEEAASYFNTSYEERAEHDVNEILKDFTI